MPMLMGGASAIYLLFQARSRFSKLMTLYSFLLSTFSLFIVNHVNDQDIAIFIMIVTCCSYFFSYYFISLF